MDELLDEMLIEIEQATSKYGPFASAHEAYGVLAEEVNEFFGWVQHKNEERIPEQMVHELIQVAAVALRYANQIEQQGLGVR